MVTELPRHQSLTVVRVGAAARFRTPLWTRTAVRAIHGDPRVEEVELEDLDSGATRMVACETVIFTADWIPDHELAVIGGVELDAGTRGPRVDSALRTSRPGVLAAGNLVHAAEPADVAALSGRHAGASAALWLLDASAWSAPAIPITCRPPLGWVSPNAVAPTLEAPPRGRFLLRASVFLRRPRIEIRQDERRLWRGTIARLGPGRSVGLPAGWRARVDPAGGAIEVALAASE